MENALLEKENLFHRPVMFHEVINFLNPSANCIYVDATLGLGGHTEKILEHSEYSAKVIGFDTDEESLSYAKNRLSKFGRQVVFVNKNFIEIDRELKALGISKVDGIIADLGISSYQIEMGGRGMSFLRDEPLDMRMDAGLRFTAYNLVNELDVDEISEIIRVYGEEKWAKRIAREIIKSRRVIPIRTSHQLARIVSDAIPKKFHPSRIHPATKTFQAFRIVVNNELENLSIFLEKAVKLLNVGARIVVISFHSLEDRIVKKTFKGMSNPCICPPGLPRCGCGKKSCIKVLTNSPLVPTTEELAKNPRARSAKMRAGEAI
ncbi:MAG: 16S rRNA (cytosine(1402)-N(4))-methyltransferase RsmH [Deltaproteobacteria bacterium]|nr:16S rRNA (cytosine(1402)-N(4))-methyltransferase RsmH [Deltaproteobacteria bacterium]